MSINTIDVTLAAIISALASEVAIHPMDTIVTRMQSSNYKQIYRQINGATSRTLFQGLYQGFGPALVAGTIGSAAFFTTYEVTKSMFENAQSTGYLLGLPRPITHIASSAAAELITCAIMNPAEVLKQNAQVYQKRPGSLSPTAETLKMLRQQPSALWAGYSTLVASQLPGICLTFALYEMFKESLLERQPGYDRGQQLRAIILSAGVAGGCASLPFIPIDVVKTRMRLAVGEQTSSFQSLGNKLGPPTRVSAFDVAGNILRKEGLPGLFRGSILTFVGGVVGSALYIGCYEGSKLYLFDAPIS